MPASKRTTWIDAMHFRDVMRAAARRSPTLASGAVVVRRHLRTRAREVHVDFGVRVTATDELGGVLSGALVRGRFLDDNLMDMPVTGATNAQGWVQLQGSGFCGTGAIAFFVDNVTSGARAFDRTTGILTKWKIPS